MGDYLNGKGSLAGMRDPLSDHDMPRSDLKPMPLKKTTRGSENFPVASRLIPRDLRPAMIAFYDVARGGDDIADDPLRTPAGKAVSLDRLEAGLDGDPDGDPRGLRLVESLRQVGRDAALSDARTLLAAFRADLEISRYETWEDLLGYCALSAVPVGRFVLELHGETSETHEPADALCTALQILNHLQDLKSDYVDLGRIYLPARWIADERDLAGERLTPALREAIDRSLRATERLLEISAVLPDRLASRRLAAEIHVILALARDLQHRLRAGDPIAGRITASRAALLTGAARGLWRITIRRRKRRLCTMAERVA
jgi:hydroxysqualene synthase